MDKLLTHLRQLSDATLDETRALRLFAACFSDSYGPSALYMLQRDERQETRFRLLNLDRVEETAPASNAFHMHIDSDLWLQLPGLAPLLGEERPRILDRVEPGLLGDLATHLPAGNAMMLLPLFLDGKVDYWGLIVGSREGQYGDVNLDQAMLLANLAATYMARIAETRQLSKANAWINKELDDITRIHRLLLPDDMQQIKGATFVAHFRASERTGGDYYDVVKLSQVFDPYYPAQRPDMWGAIVADAAGHGAAAAVEVAMFDAILRTYHGRPEQGPASVFDYANRYFFTRTARGAYITAIIMNYDPRSRQLLYANAGHPPLLLKRPGSSQVEVLDGSAGIPLGVERDWHWEAAAVGVPPGSIVVAYTDGLIEAHSSSGEQFGEARLRQLVGETESDIDDLSDRILQAVYRHMGEREPHDDQTLLIIKIEQ
jgi:sigma-B regulation protein RsbU (phosphoserine phosphatase)